MSNQEEYWSQHLAAIEREGISIRAYAEREKVSAWSLYERRRMLKAAGLQAAPQAGSFVAVQVRACGQPRRLGGIATDQPRDLREPAFGERGQDLILRQASQAYHRVADFLGFRLRLDGRRAHC